ncbi:MAG: BamA/TamA family outer membrane protein, partial [Thermoanaerobaculia bacterium]
ILEEDRRRLVRWYEEHYDRGARVELRRDAALDPADRRVTAVFRIEEEPHRFAGRVDVTGNLRTRDRVVRADLKVVPGAPLTDLGVRESEARLARRRLYDPEKSAITVPASGEVRDIEVRVKEERAGLLGLSGGVAASLGEGEIASLSLVQPNFDLLALPGPRRPWRDAFSGGGQLLELEFAPGTRQSEFLLRFEEPYLYNTRHSLSLLGATRLYERHGYDETRLRGEATVGRHWGGARRLATRLGYVVEDVNVADVSAVSVPDVAEARGHTLLAYPTLRLSWRELRHDPYSGPRGFAVEALGDASLRATGSEGSFLRAQLSADHWQPVTAWLNALLPGEPLSEWRGLEHVLRLGAGFGWAEGVEGDELPIFERFFLGGPRSVRGFDYRGIGPAAREVRLGGEAFLRGTVEYSFPLAIRELRAVALFDVAEVEPELG